jgi:hypothetical protein
MINSPRLEMRGVRRSFGAAKAVEGGWRIGLNFNA